MCSSMNLLMLLTTVLAQQVSADGACLSTSGAQQESSEGRCLLAKKKEMGKISMLQEEALSAFDQVSLKQRNWRKRHQSVENAMNASKTLLDRFIAAQTTSTDHCSSRLMESKRILDGLLKDVRTLNAQIMSREEVLETETENLKITKMSIDAVKTEYKESITVCKTERAEAFAELKTYTSELSELKSIANPSIRMDIAHSVTIKEGASLMEVKMDKQMCEAFLAFAKRHNRHKALADPKRDCDKQREELQEAFEEAYKETTILKEEARKRTVDETCFETAETKKTAELVPLVSQRDIAVEKIEVASQAIAAIEPVLNLVKDKAEKLRTHISETLTPECKDAGEASKLLQRVRELIISLEECPGRNDFKLQIPSVKTPDEEDEEEEPVKPTGIDAKPDIPVPDDDNPKKPTGEDAVPKDDEVPDDDEVTKAIAKEEAAKEEAAKEEAPTEAPMEEAPADDAVPKDDEVPSDDAVPKDDEVPSDDAVPKEANEEGPPGEDRAPPPPNQSA